MPMIEEFVFENENGEYLVKKEFSHVIAIRKLSQGTVLHQQGKFLVYNYYILKGIARSYMYKNGKDITTYFAVDHTPIAAIDMLQKLNKQSFLNIELLDDSIVAEIDYQKIRDIIFNNIAYTKKYCMYLDQEYMKLAMIQISNRFTTAKDRYNQFCSEYPQIIKKVKLSHIASYLDISMETLSRIRAANK